MIKRNYYLIAPSTFTTLAAAAYTSEDAPRPLLPNLRNLHWINQPSSDPPTLPTFAPFLGPGLTVLGLFVRISESRSQALNDCRNMFAALSKVCASLQKFNVLPETGSTNVDVWDEEVSAWLEECVQLEEITLPHDWRGKIVEVLGRLPRLRTIKTYRGIRTLTKDPRHFTSIAHRTDVFPSLISVAMESDVSWIPLPIGGPSVFSRLEALELAVQPCSPSGLKDMLASLADRCLALTSLELLLYLKDIAFQHLLPLLSLTGITKFIIEYQHQFTLGPAEVQQLCRAWPNLKTFEALGRGRSGEGIKCSFETLPAFAANCSQLHSLKVRLIPLGVPQGADVFSSTAQFKRLRYLDVTYSDPLTNYIDAGFFLAHLCGRDTQIIWQGTGFGPESEKPENWKLVEGVFRQATRMRAIQGRKLA